MLTGSCGSEIAGDGDDFLYGDASANTIRGGHGDDRIGGRAGDDVLVGDLGQDRLFGNDGADRMFGGVGNDILAGGSGADSLRGGPGNDRLSGDEGTESFFFREGDGKDVILDLSASDRLVLDDALWTGRPDAERVVERFGRASGQDWVLSFDGGETVRAIDVSRAMLIDAIEIV